MYIPILIIFNHQGGGCWRDEEWKRVGGGCKGIIMNRGLIVTGKHDFDSHVQINFLSSSLQ
jgi:hypothetical protein